MHDTTNRLTVYPPSLREQAVGDSAVPRMELAEWAERYGVVAGVTTPGRGFSLGLLSGGKGGQGVLRWRAFRGALPPPLPPPRLPPPGRRPPGPAHRHHAGG